MSQIFLITGNDPSLLSQQVRSVAAKCLGDMDPNHTLVKLETEDYETETGHELSALVSAASTPPMLEPHRVIEARNLGLFGSEKDWEGFFDYLLNPLDTTDLILVWEKAPGQQRLSPVPKKLKDAVSQAGGEIVSASKPMGAKNVRGWFETQIQSSGLTLDAPAASLIQEQLGEDYGRLRSVLEALESAYGAGGDKEGKKDAKSLSVDEVRPYISEGGSVPVWELTAALSKGDGIKSISCLNRRLTAGEHPVAIVAFLVNHYMRLARLDSLDSAGNQSRKMTPTEAAKELGISEYPAKLALEESQNLGSKKIAQIFKFLTKADSDLKGGSSLEGYLVMEILIARIAQQYRLPKN